MNQPPSGATPKKSVQKKIRPPIAYAQNAYAASRGNGRSRAPSMPGSRYTAIASIDRHGEEKHHDRCRAS